MGWIDGRQLDRDHRGLRNVCGACGHEGTTKNPLVVADDGMRIHRSHTEDPRSGYYLAQQAR